MLDGTEAGIGSGETTEEDGETKGAAEMPLGETIGTGGPRGIVNPGGGIPLGEGIKGGGNDKKGTAGG